ncbi:MAG TPA: nucleotidyltransferase [Desulfotomaculum sp.]|nr:nucleotidyltransferase [Desulfotomaculum sp.]
MRLDKIKIQRIRNYFKDQPVKKAYLFGSHSRNVADDDSDVDILVELDHSKPIGLKFVRMQFELEGILKTKVDLISDKAISKYIRPYIDNDKELIYEK